MRFDPTFALLALCVFTSATTQTIAGFGGVVVSLTLGALLYPIETLLPLLVPISLVVTGYLIQTFTSPTTLTALGWAHLVLGLVCSAAVLAHRLVLKGRRRRRRPGALPVLAVGASPSEAFFAAPAAEIPSEEEPPVEVPPLEPTVRT